MSKIIPAILERNFDTIQEKLLSDATFCKQVQIDVCDGKFVDGSTYLFNGKEDLEGWQTLNYEADLMVEDVLKHFEICAEIGFSKIVTHHKSFDAELLGKILKIIMEKDIEWGIVFYDENVKEAFDKYDQYADYYQIMGIKKVGHQGENFDKNCLNRIKLLRELTEKKIQVDGGMNEESIRACFLAGANNFVVGSYLDKALDKISTYRELNSIVK